MEPLVIRPHPHDEFYTAERCHILEMSNSPADTALSIARARVAPGLTTEMHRVKNTVERYVILAGEGRVEIAGSLTQSVLAGDVVLIPANAEQRITNTGDTDLVFLALCTPPFDANNYEAAS